MFSATNIVLYILLFLLSFIELKANQRRNKNKNSSQLRKQKRDIERVSCLLSTKEESTNMKRLVLRYKCTFDSDKRYKHLYQYFFHVTDKIFLNVCTPYLINHHLSNLSFFGCQFRKTFVRIWLR